MSKIWEPQSIEVYVGWCDTIKEEVSEKLSQWEFDFVISISLQLANNNQLTEKQAKILERIYSEKTS